MKNLKKINTTIKLISIVGLSYFATHQISLHEVQKELLSNVYYSEIEEEPTIITVFEESKLRSANVEYMTVDKDMVRYRWDKECPEEMIPVAEILEEENISVRNKRELNKQLVKILRNN